MRAIVKTSDSVIEIINTDLEIDLKTENIDLKRRIEKYRKKMQGKPDLPLSWLYYISIEENFSIIKND